MSWLDHAFSHIRQIEKLREPADLYSPARSALARASSAHRALMRSNRITATDIIETRDALGELLKLVKG